MFPSQPVFRCVSLSTPVSVSTAVSESGGVGHLEQGSQVSKLATGDRRKLLGSSQRSASSFFHLGACEPRSESQGQAPP